MSDSREIEVEEQQRNWLLEAGRGNQRAFAELVECYQEAIYAFVVNMLGAREGAEDITQEVFLRLWKAAPRWKPKASVRSYLYLIARRVVYNEFRRRKRKPVSSLDELLEDSLSLVELTEQGRDAAKQAQEAEFWRAIERALESLPEKQRAVVLLRRDGELSYEEIGLSLKLSVSSVKSLLFRARSNLREQLAQWV